jgi:LruC domain-containing protein
MKRLLILMFIFLIFTACENKDEAEEPNSMADLNVSPDFAFNTTKIVELNLTSRDASGNLQPNVPFSIFKKDPATASGSRVLRSATNDFGNFENTIKLPAYYNKIYIRPAASEVQELAINHLSSENAKIDADFIYSPNKLKYNKNLDSFEPVTASDNGFVFTLQNIVADYENSTATITISITNNNNKKFKDAYFTIPSSVLATEIEPNNTNYESPAGMTYWVQYPVNHWIMGNSIAYYGNNGFKNGETDYYYITLPLEVFEFWNSMEMYATATGNTSGQVTLDFSYTPEFSMTEYYPAENEFGTLAYEDYWPQQGDYDMNDLVIDYNMSLEKSYVGDLETIFAQFNIRAIGASYTIGFGFQLPDFIQVNGNVTSTSGLAYVEADNRTIVLFDDARDIVTENSDQFINTDPALPYIETSVMTISIPVVSSDNNTDEDWFLPPYNPFIFVNERAKEIHLANFPPTNQADLTLFNTQDDASDPVSDYYYRTAANLPWAFHIAESSLYPIEKIQIIQAFPEFYQWAESEGNQATDWYTFPDENLIYPVP